MLITSSYMLAYLKVLFPMFPNPTSMDCFALLNRHPMLAHTIQRDTNIWRCPDHTGRRVNPPILI